MSEQSSLLATGEKVNSTLEALQKEVRLVREASTAIQVETSAFVANEDEIAAFVHDLLAETQAERQVYVCIL